MKKTDKKIDNTLRLILTEVCEEVLSWGDGFQWLTHFANYQNFPASLSIVCVYDCNANLQSTDTEAIRSIIKAKLDSVAIKVGNIEKCVSFDSEENCSRENNGSWKRRFN